MCWSQLRTALSGNVAGLSTYTTFGRVGFKTRRDGTVTIDNAKLDTALANNYNATKALFITNRHPAALRIRVVKAVDFLDAVDTGALRSEDGDHEPDQQAHRRNRPQRKISRRNMKNGCDCNSPPLDSTLQQLQSQTNALKALQ